MMRINVLSIVSVLVFCAVVTYNISFESNPLGYVSILILFAAESIRAYTEGLGRGVEIIQEIRDGK